MYFLGHIGFYGLNLDNIFLALLIILESKNLYFFRFVSKEFKDNF